MWPVRYARIDVNRTSDEPVRCPRGMPVRLADTLVVAAVVLAYGCIYNPSRILGAGALPQANSNGQAAAAADSSRFIVASRQKLNDLQAEVLGLGAAVLGSLEAANRPRIEDSIVNQRITVGSADAQYENTKLTRELAEIAVPEYEQGIFKQDEATLMGEVKLAQNNCDRSRDAIEAAEGRLAKIKQASRGTAEDLALEYSFEDSVAQAVLREPRARLEVDKAQAKLDALRQFTGPKRVKELKSEVEKARSDELAKKARWEIEKFKLIKLHEAATVQAPGVHEKQVLTLLDQAVRILDQVSTKLDQADKDQTADEPLRKEIADLTGQLQALVERARGEVAAAKWAKLKPRVRDAAARYLGAQAK